MREQNRKKTSDSKRSDTIRHWSWWDCVSASYWKRELGSVNRLYYYDWRTRTYKPAIPTSWLTYHYTIIVISGATFAAGIGQCILMLWSR